VIAPVVAACVVVSASIGASTPVSLLIVLGQLGLYVAVYGRLVRGRWGVGRSGKESIGFSAKVNTR
jgi:hypothetical protein